MENKVQGTIWRRPVQVEIPDSEYAQQKAHVAFSGRVKVSQRKPSAARPLDPSERMESKGTDWPNPIWTPVPEKDGESREFFQILSDGWKFSEAPTGKYWEDTTDISGWDEVSVPAELMALGYDIRRGREYVYKRQLFIPDNWEGRKILLKFGMVYEYSKVWIDGHLIREHEGAFTSFECDITAYAKPGTTVCLTVMCKHRPDALMDWYSMSGEEVQGYAGLIDEVILLALPEIHLQRFLYEVELDTAYTNAVLKVTASGRGKECRLSLRLLNQEGKNLLPEGTCMELPGEEVVLALPVENPLKWDAEHPNLYRLEGIVNYGDRQTLTYSLNVGFRKVERIGNHLYINGVKTKLRGAALYGHDPILGKAFGRERLEKIVKAAKWANINYLRSSAYPERAYLYELCDLYGIYVEECAPANFQRGTWDSQGDEKIRPTSNLPAYTAGYMNQFTEMVERDRNHPSVIIWEYGNESDWGINFQAELDYLKREDTSRLTAGTWDNSHTSLASYHYPEYDEIIPNASLYDEYVHVATHDRETLRRDTGIRNAWGLSVKKGWDTLYDADGVVGAAIFAMGDYVIQRPDGDVYAASYGQWGLLDAWGREKPELWLTKKGYSPVKLPDKQVEKPAKGMPMAIWVKNRYNHTNLKELKFVWKSGAAGGQLMGPDTAPGQSGALVFPKREWENGEILSIEIYEKNGCCVDAYELYVGEKPERRMREKETAQHLEIQRENGKIYVIGSEFEIIFSEETGLIVEGRYRGQRMIESGPYLNFYGVYYKPSVFQNDDRGVFGVKASGWQCEDIFCTMEHGDAVVKIHGSYPGGRHLDMWEFVYGYEPVLVEFTVRITGSGTITTECQIENPPEEYVLETGISYILSDEVDRMTWEKESVYSAYPEDHIGRPKGMAKRYRGFGKDTYRQEPQWRWSMDETNFALYGGADQGGHGTNDFLASREQIYYASAILKGREERIQVEGDGKSVSVRLRPAQDEDDGFPKGIKLTTNTELYYDLGSGSSAIVKSGDGYMGNYTYPEIILEKGYTAKVEMQFSDSDE